MTSLRTRPLVDRLAAATAACAEIDALVPIFFDIVVKEVPFVFGCLATIDPASELITRAYKSDAVPLGDEEFSAIEYGASDINQFAEIGRRREPVGVLSVDTGGQPNECRRFREYMVPNFGFTDEVRVVCKARNTSWGAFALYRGPGEPPFTAGDGRLLASVHELVAERLQHVLFSATPNTDVMAAGPAVVIVDADDRVTDVTAAAHQHIHDLGGWDKGSLPACVLAVTALARTATRSAQSRVLGRSGRWLALRAMALDGSAGRRSVVLTVDAAAPAAVGQMTLAARGLTAREQDVSQLVLQGASTKAIAAALHLSPHTVQHHLKSIFGKLDVSSRREMIAQLALDD